MVAQMQREGDNVMSRPLLMSEHSASDLICERVTSNQLSLTSSSNYESVKLEHRIVEGLSRLSVGKWRDFSGICDMTKLSPGVRPDPRRLWDGPHPGPNSMGTDFHFRRPFGEPRANSHSLNLILCVRPKQRKSMFWITPEYAFSRQQRPQNVSVHVVRFKYSRMGLSMSALEGGTTSI